MEVYVIYTQFFRKVTKKETLFETLCQKNDDRKTEIGINFIGLNTKKAAIL